MANLGYIGLGAMGGRIAARLLAKGHAVTGYNRTRAKARPLIDRGMAWADSPKAVAQATDVILVNVADSASLEAVADGPDGFVAGLSNSKVVIDMSTVSPARSRLVVERVRKMGADMLEAPVSGGVSLVEQGRLSVMVGGRRTTFERVKPLLDDVGQKVTYVGESGLALSLKLATNISIAAQMLALAESVVLAEKSGIPRETVVEVLTSSAIASPLVQYKAPCILKMPKQAQFTTNMMQKDMKLALELGRELQVPLLTGALINELLSAARAQGFGDHDFATLFHVLERLSGVPG